MHRFIFIGVVYCFFAVFDPVSALAGVTVSCYPASADHDQDGYAKSGTHPVDVRLHQRYSPLSCPSGYVDFADDCDDENARVHPYNLERARNEIDDNCYGRVDEPIFVYTRELRNTFRDHIAVRAFLSKQDHLLHPENYWVDFTVDALAYDDPAEENQTLLSKVSLESIKVPRSSEINFTIPNLRPGTIYRIRMQFFTRQLVSASPLRFVFVPATIPTPWFYTTTRHAGTDGDVRTRILLNGFSEYMLSERGVTGYSGSVYQNGRRFGCNGTEHWCSEFYTFAARNELEDIQENTHSTSLIEYFQDHFIFYRNQNQFNRALPGDYVAFDWGNDGDTNHSAMFLAIKDHFIWTLDGNCGNKVKVRRRRLNSEVYGIGRILMTDTVVRRN